MKKILFLISFLFSINAVQAQYWQWAKTASASQPSLGMGSEIDMGSLKIDSKGAIHMSGAVNAMGGTAHFDNFSFDCENSNTRALFLKYDGNGNAIWAKSTPYASATGPNLPSTGILPYFFINPVTFIDKNDNRIIAGNFISNTFILDNDTLVNPLIPNTTIFTAKYNNNDQLIWSKKISSAGIFNDIYTRCITGDDFDNTYLIGSYTGLYAVFDNDTIWNADSISPKTHMFITKINNFGDIEWVRQIVGDGGIGGNSISIINQDIYISITSLGTYAIIGNDTINGHIILSKYDSNGNHKWSKYDKNNYGGIVKVVAGTQDEIYFLGTYASEFNLDSSLLFSNSSNQSFIGKVDALGNTIWLKNLGVGKSESLDMSLTEPENLWVAGSIEDSTFICGADTLKNIFYAMNSFDYFIQKINIQNGNTLYSFALNLCKDLNLRSILVKKDSLYLTGNFFCPSVTFGTTTLTQQLIYDRNWFFAKYVLPPLGVDDVPSNPSFSIHPNPFTNQLQINKTFAQEADLLLYDGLGKLVVHQKIKENSSVISTEDLPNGLYFYTFINAKGERLQAGKLMKE